MVLGTFRLFFFHTRTDNKEKKQRSFFRPYACYQTALRSAQACFYGYSGFFWGSRRAAFTN